MELPYVIQSKPERELLNIGNRILPIVKCSTGMSMPEFLTSSNRPRRMKENLENEGESSSKLKHNEKLSRDIARSLDSNTAHLGVLVRVARLD